MISNRCNFCGGSLYVIQILHSWYTQEQQKKKCSKCGIEFSEIVTKTRISRNVTEF